MSKIPIADPVRTQAIVNQYLGNAKKNLGQNFLVDLNAINEILKAADIKENDQVIEVGPGIGSLTEQMLLAGAKVLSYEIDSDIPEILHNELPSDLNNENHFKLVLKDILKADFKQDLAGFFELSKPIKVVANLPYYITTPIIFYFIHSDLKFESLTLMMQKEVAQRLAAKSGHKDFGPLTIAVQTKMQVNLAFEVKNTSFIPKPKVDSSVVTLKPLQNSVDVGNESYFEKIVKICFMQRRKTLANNLKTLIKDKNVRLNIISELKLPEKVRPEQVTINQFVQLAKLIYKNSN